MEVYIHYFLEHLAKNVFLVFLTTILSSLGLMCVHHYYSVYQRLNVYRSYGYEKGIILYSNNIWGSFKSKESGSNEQVDPLIGSIRAVEGVKSAHYLTSSTSVMAVDGENVIYMMEMPKSGKCPWPLTSGRMPSSESKNEICISSNFENKYKIGNEINCELYYGENTQPRKCSMKITGFFDENSYMPMDAETTFKYEIMSTSGKATAYATCSRLLTTNGETVAFLYDSDYVFVLPEDGYNTASLKEKLLKITDPQASKAFDYSDFKEKCYKDNKEVNDMINIFFISTFVLLLAVLSSYTIIQISVNKGEMLTYYINGCTWKKATGIACFATLPMLIFGLIFGVCSYKYIPLFMIMTNGSYLYNTQLAVLVCGFIIFIYISLTGVFCFVTARQSPIEMLRSE